MWVKKSQTSDYQEKVIKFPKIIRIYNFNHNFIDAVKHVISRARNTLRARKAWRVKLNAWMYVLLSNVFHYFKIIKNFSKRMYCFSKFIFHVVIAKATQKKSSYGLSPIDTIVLHSMMSNSSKRKSCKICKDRTSWFCLDCDTNPHLCQYPCSVQYHNSNKQFLF